MKANDYKRINCLYNILLNGPEVQCFYISLVLDKKCNCNTVGFDWKLQEVRLFYWFNHRKTTGLVTGTRPDKLDSAEVGCSDDMMS